MLTEASTSEKLAFARKHCDWTEERWLTVLVMDELSVRRDANQESPFFAETKISESPTAGVMDGLDDRHPLPDAIITN